MTPALTLPPHPQWDIVDFQEVSAEELAKADEVLAKLEQCFKKDEDALEAVERAYDSLCERADQEEAPAQIEESVRILWEYACESIALDQRQLARHHRLWLQIRSKYGFVGASFIHRYHTSFISGVTRHAERLAELMRTIAVVWEELELETPEEIYEAVWTIRISPLAYLRAMWNLFWSSIRHPLSTTVIELKTGRVLRTES